MVISLLETVVITNVLHHNSMKYKEVPQWVKIVVLKHIASLICYRWPEDVSPLPKPDEDKPNNLNCSSGPCIPQTENNVPVSPPSSYAGNLILVHSFICKDLQFYYSECISGSFCARYGHSP